MCSTFVEDFAPAPYILFCSIPFYSQQVGDTTCQVYFFGKIDYKASIPCCYTPLKSPKHETCFQTTFLYFIFLNASEDCNSTYILCWSNEPGLGYIFSQQRYGLLVDVNYTVMDYNFHSCLSLAAQLRSTHTERVQTSAFHLPLFALTSCAWLLHEVFLQPH